MQTVVLRVSKNYSKKTMIVFFLSHCSNIFNYEFQNFQHSGVPTFWGKNGFKVIIGGTAGKAPGAPEALRAAPGGPQRRPRPLGASSLYSNNHSC